tara:strand:- start:9 stop:425 length:417 start_codon:yes stop_codon:yes gene_type:complete
MATKLTHAEYAAKHTEIFARMSANFLATPLPSDWDTWNEEKLDTFISDNHWQPFEYWDVKDVYELIDQLTVDVMDLMGFKMSDIERTWKVKVEATTTREVIVHANTEYEAQTQAHIEMVSLVGGENTRVLHIEETTND